MESVSGTCPFLVAVVADRLWMYPVPAYCRRPDAPVRVLAPGTLSGVCTTAAHLGCPGFQTSGVARDTGPAEAPLRARSFDDLLDEAVQSTAAPPTPSRPSPG